MRKVNWLTDSEDWTPIDLHDKLIRIVAGASARIFVGHPMCRNEEVSVHNERVKSMVAILS